MKIDSNIVKGIDQYILDNAITSKEFAKRMKVSEPTIIKWRKPGNGVVEPRWKMLFPLIRQYLPEDRIYLDDAGKEQYSSLIGNKGKKPQVIPQMAPVMTEKQLLKFDDMLESVEQFAIRKNFPRIEYRAKHKNKDCVFALQIESNDHEPIIPQGSTLYLTSGADAKPSTGNLVLCRVSGKNKIIVGKYLKDKSEFQVIPYGKNGENAVSGKIGEAKKILDWIFPVMFYEVITM